MRLPPHTAALLFGLCALSFAADESRLTVDAIDGPQKALHAFAYSRGKQVIMRKYIFSGFRRFELIHAGRVVAVVETGRAGNRCTTAPKQSVQVVLIGAGKDLTFNRVEIHRGRTIVEAYDVDERRNLIPVAAAEYRLLNKPK